MLFQRSSNILKKSFETFFDSIPCHCQYAHTFQEVYKEEMVLALAKKKRHILFSHTYEVLSFNALLSTWEINKLLDIWHTCETQKLLLTYLVTSTLWCQRSENSGMRWMKWVWKGWQFSLVFFYKITKWSQIWWRRSQYISFSDRIINRDSTWEYKLQNSKIRTSTRIAILTIILTKFVFALRYFLARRIVVSFVRLC